MNQYETVFILTPVLSEEQMKEAVSKFETLLTDNGAEIVFKDFWECASSPILFKRNLQASIS